MRSHGNGESVVVSDSISRGTFARPHADRHQNLAATRVDPALIEQLSPYPHALGLARRDQGLMAGG
ncbi:MAG: hypothetical protein ABI343_05160 [Burkholderiaceae bacterium]